MLILITIGAIHPEQIKQAIMAMVVLALATVAGMGVAFLALWLFMKFLERRYARGLAGWKSA